jgi:hypothetical protein
MVMRIDDTVMFRLSSLRAGGHRQRCRGANRRHARQEFAS